MEIIALSKSVRVSPRKTRLVADAIRKMSIANALNSLSAVRQRAAIALSKTLKSAVANAKNNAKLAEESLIIKTIDISEGPAYKRYRPSTRGRVHPYKKKTSNIRVVLEGTNGTES
jgi:large subunit ribosomal protein L22